jgi:Cu/Ag efflux pump CusA
LLMRLSKYVKAMTVLMVAFGLMPGMLNDRAGLEVVRCIAAATIGGMLRAALLSLFVIPAAGSCSSKGDPWA